MLIFTKVDVKQRMKRLNKLTVWILVVLIGAMVMQSCASSKGCGCGADLNRAYKPPKRFN